MRFARAPKCLIRRPRHRISPCESSRRAIVIVKQTAQPSTSTNATNGPVRRRRARDQCVLDPLVIPLAVIVRDVFGDCASKMPLAERNQPIEALLLDRPHEPLRVAVGCPERRANDPDSRLFEEPARHDSTCGRDQHTTARQCPVDRIGQVTHGLNDECFVRAPRGAGHVDSPRRRLDNGRGVARHQPSHSPHLRQPMRAEKCAPGRRPLATGWDALSFQDVRNR